MTALVVPTHPRPVDPTLVAFDADSHSYWYGLERIPSVSEILRPLTEPWLRAIPEAALNWKRELGIAVHKACELYDRDELDEEQLDPAIVPYLEGYKRFCVDHRPHWVATEELVVDRNGRYAGTLDRAGEVLGEPAVLDIKTSLQLRRETALQVWAYASAYAPESQPALAALQLLKDGTYRLHEFSDYARYNITWRALLDMHEWSKS